MQKHPNVHSLLLRKTLKNREMYEPWTPSWERRKKTSPAPPQRTASPCAPMQSPSPVLSERAPNNNSASRPNLKRNRNQDELRALVRGLSGKERAQKLHDIMTLNSTLFVDRIGAAAATPATAPLKQTYHNLEEGVLGCKHYARAVFASAPCCDKFYACRFCHDEASNHSLNRKSVDRLKCMRCGHEQDFAANPEV